MKSMINYFSKAMSRVCAAAVLICGFAAQSPSKEAPLQTSPVASVQSSLSTMNLVSEEGQVDPHLIAFLDLYEVQHDGTVDSINQAMQAHFLRRPGTERRDLANSQLDTQVQEEAMALLTQMGLVEAIPPTPVQADYFLLFGAMLERVKTRLLDFVQQYSQGTLQCQKVVLLGGVRQLREHELEGMEKVLGTEGLAAFAQRLGKPNKEALTEADLLRFAWETYATEPMKATFHEGQHLFFVNSTCVKDGTNYRPTTKTTIEAWLEDFCPAPGSCHANVEKPYGIRMEKVLRLALEKHSQALKDTDKRFSITWNSPMASENLSLAVYRDELARTLHAELALKSFIVQGT